MIYGLYQSAAGMMTNEYRQNVLANNVANAETIGFKRDVPVFAERIPADLAGLREGPSAESLAAMTGGIWLGRTETDFSAGGLVSTENPLDVALDGPGFLAVQVGDEVQFTRDGRFTTTPNGQLVAISDGAPILGVGGTPLMLDPRAGLDHVQIDEDGRIFQDERYVGQFQLADFDNYSTLRKVGAQRFTAPDNTAVAAPALVRNGYLETSGADALPELVDMIEASRAYQINAQMVTLQDQTASRLISTVLRA